MLGSRITSSNTQAQKRGGDMFWYICPLSNNCTLQLQLDVQKPLIPRTLYICIPWIWNYLDVFGVQKQLASESAAKNLYHPMKDLHNQVGNTSRGWVLRVPLRSGNFFPPGRDSNSRKRFIDFLP